MNATISVAECPFLRVLKHYWPDLTAGQQSDLARDVDYNCVDAKSNSRDIYAVTLKTKLSSIDLIERIGTRWEKLDNRLRRDLSRRTQQLAVSNVCAAKYNRKPR